VHAASSHATIQREAEAPWDPFRSFRQRLHDTLNSTRRSSTSTKRSSTRRSRSVPRARSQHSGTTVLAATDGESAPSNQTESSRAPVGKEACVALFMDMELSSVLPGRPWILGIPLLRAYKVRFDRSKRSVALAQMPLGSEHCAGCVHGAEPPAKTREFFPAASAPSSAAAVPATDALPVLSQKASRTYLHALLPDMHQVHTAQPRPRRTQEARNEQEQRQERLRMSLSRLHVPQWVRRAQLAPSRRPMV